VPLWEQGVDGAFFRNDAVVGGGVLAVLVRCPSRQNTLPTDVLRAEAVDRLSHEKGGVAIGGSCVSLRDGSKACR